MPMSVRVARVNSATKEVALYEGATIRDALTAADISLDNEEIKIDGQTVELSDEAVEGELITVVPKIKGN